MTSIEYPSGILAITDNGGRTIDRYTVVFEPFVGFGGLDYYPAYYLSERPSHPRGVGIRNEFTEQPTLRDDETLIPLDKLPPDCRAIVEAELRDQ